MSHEYIISGMKTAWWPGYKPCPARVWNRLRIPSPPLVVAGGLHGRCDIRGGQGFGHVGRLIACHFGPRCIGIWHMFSRWIRLQVAFGKNCLDHRLLAQFQWQVVRHQYWLCTTGVWQGSGYQWTYKAVSSWSSNFKSPVVWFVLCPCCSKAISWLFD